MVYADTKFHCTVQYNEPGLSYTLFLFAFSLVFCISWFFYIFATCRFRFLATSFAELHSCWLKSKYSSASLIICITNFSIYLHISYVLPCLFICVLTYLFFIWINILFCKLYLHQTALAQGSIKSSISIQIICLSHYSSTNWSCFT